MGCPPLEELLGGAGAEHAARCAGCRAVLDLAGARSAARACGLAEALLAARAAGALAPDGEQALLRHLDTCAECRALAQALDSPVAPGAFAAGEAAPDLVELTTVPAENYERGQEIGRGGMGRIVLARDRRLGRAVAIKELLDTSLRARFEHEARLTARLQHPAIVSVHEAGRWPNGDPFYAMKYVSGEPLHKVIAGKATLAERLTLLPHFTTVAEAIAYAHSERVIHRDLKPHNIVVGGFGETVVIDWGLAKDLAAPDAGPAPPPGAGGAALTAGGAGTPAYMAPEQARGEPPDEGVDIYALGATLHHLLAGEPPDQAPLPDDTPAELRAIVRKAMAADRGDRYRTAAELADELKRFQTGQLVTAHRYSVRDLATRWLRRHRVGLLAAAVLAAAVAAFVVARGTAAIGQACAGAGRRLAGAWDPTVRAAVDASFRASGRPYAADTFRRVAAAVDGYAARWTAMHEETCEATAVRHEQSDAMLDLRMQCLDRRLGELRALTALFARAPDGDVVDRAMAAVDKLDDLGACADADAVAATAPPPADPGQRVAIAALRGLLHEVQALELGGKYKPALEVVRPIVAHADRLAYPPVQLEARTRLGSLQAKLLDFKGQEDSQRRRLELAARLRDDRAVADAWTRLLTALTLSDRAGEALALRTTAEIAVARAGDRSDMRATLLAEPGRAYQQRAEYGAAETVLRQAVALTESAPDHRDSDLDVYLNSLGTVLREAGKYADARATLERSVRIRERRLGADHPAVAGALINLANLGSDEGEHEEARALHARAVAVFEGAYGPNGATLAIPLTNLGGEEISLGRYDDAVEHLARAAAIQEHAAGGSRRIVAATHENLGVAFTFLGRYDDAERELERARALSEASAGTDHPEYALILYHLGRVARERGRCRDAIDLARRAIAIDEKAMSTDYPGLAAPLVLEGQCDVNLGRARDAVPVLERAIALRRAAGGDPADAAEAEFALGCARWAIAPDDATALALVKQARAELAALGPAQQARAADLDRSLAARATRASRTRP